VTARIAVFHGFGQPLELVECPIPDLKEGETLVKINCCALCRSDLHTYEGRRTEATPTILGHEAVGQVVESRAGLAPGMRITWGIFACCTECFFCRNGLPQKCESLFKYGHARLTEEQPLSGGLATHILLRKGTLVVPLPDSIPDEIAVLANCSTATAFASIRNADLRTNAVVAVLGMGILGLTAAAILSSQGHQVIAFDPDPAKAELAKDFGCTEFFSDVDAFNCALSNQTQSRGADACLELAGSQSAAQLSLTSVRIGGSIVWTGAAAPVGEVAIQPEQILRRQLTIKGVHNYIPGDLSDAVNFLSMHWQRFRFADLIGEGFALKEVDAAFRVAAAAPSRILVIL
jgi:putative phosphonate catabolism associated alcohol dehydrogenase